MLGFFFNSVKCFCSLSLQLAASLAFVYTHLECVPESLIIRASLEAAKFVLYYRF